MLRSKVNKMDKDLMASFKNVGSDVDILTHEFYGALVRIARLEKQVKSLKKDQHRSTKVGPLTGRTYTTLAGRVKAIQEHLGVKFEVTPKEVVRTPAKISAVVEKKKLASKK